MDKTPVPIGFKEEFNELLTDAGYDLKNDNFGDTAQRFYSTILDEFRAPHLKDETPEQILENEFDEEYSGIVVMRDIEFKAACAHHLFPFFGHVHIGYLPEGETVGISKLARIVQYYANCLTSQEAMTRQIADAINNILNPKGVIVNVEAIHTCMIARGVKQSETRTITSDVRGIFKTNDAGCKDEFFALIGRGK